MSTLDDDKIYSEIHESQFWDANQEESKSERSLVSEEAIRDEDFDFERVERQQQKSEQRKIDELKEEMKSKLGMEEFDLEVMAVKQ